MRARVWRRLTRIPATPTAHSGNCSAKATLKAPREYVPGVPAPWASSRTPTSRISTTEAVNPMTLVMPVAPPRRWAGLEVRA